jgi:hypothetical protein
MFLPAEQLLESEKHRCPSVVIINTVGNNDSVASGYFTIPSTRIRLISE